MDPRSGCLSIQQQMALVQSSTSLQGLQPACLHGYYAYLDLAREFAATSTDAHNTHKPRPLPAMSERLAGLLPPLQEAALCDELCQYIDQFN